MGKQRVESLLDKLDYLVQLLEEVSNLVEDIRNSIEEMAEFAESISGVTPDEFGDFYDYEFEKGDYLDQGEWE